MTGARGLVATSHWTSSQQPSLRVPSGRPTSAGWNPTLTTAGANRSWVRPAPGLHVQNSIRSPGNEVSVGVGILNGDPDDDAVRDFLPPRAEFLGTSVRPHPVGVVETSPAAITLSRTGLARDLIPTWKRFAFGRGVRTRVKRQEPNLRGSRFQAPGGPFAQEG